MEYYKVMIIFTDGETLDVAVKLDEIEQFFENINNGKPHKEATGNFGFYVPEDQIRYMTFAKVKKEEETPPDESPEEKDNNEDDSESQ